MADDENITRQFRVRDLEVGMVVARPVHSEDGSRLVSEGEALAVEDIDRLKQWNVRRVTVTDESAREEDNS